LCYVDPTSLSNLAFDGCPLGFYVRATLRGGECITDNSALQDGWWNTHLLDSEMLEEPLPLRSLPSHSARTIVIDLMPILETACSHGTRKPTPSDLPQHIDSLSVKFTIFTSGDLTDHVEVQRTFPRDSGIAAEMHVTGQK